MGRLSGKVAVVTGAARGMGAATARLFAAEGAKVILTDMLEDEGKAVAAEIGAAASFIKHDVASDEDWAKVVAAAKEAHGKIDVLVNNAGVVHFTPIDALSAEDARRVLGINTIGPMLGIKHVSAVMKTAGKGSIINISSVDGMRGCNGLTIYTASKWALRGLTKSLAYELGTSGIRVNSVHPGGVDTPMGNARGLPPEQLSAAFCRVPLQRIGQPEEIAAASLFLASDEASYVTGAEIAVDGGWSAGYYQPVLPGAPEGLAP
jgi:3alpha(or 20beta)-hydroxysteroid dehydrogenase